MTIDSLLDDPELLEELERIIKNPNHEFICKLDQSTINDLEGSVKVLKGKLRIAKFWRLVSLWKATAFLVALGVLISALAFYYAQRKD